MNVAETSGYDDDIPPKPDQRDDEIVILTDRDDWVVRQDPNLGTSSWGIWHRTLRVPMWDARWIWEQQAQTVLDQVFAHRRWQWFRVSHIEVIAGKKLP
jgi:hypothetical protein